MDRVCVLISFTRWKICPASRIREEARLYGQTNVYNAALVEGAYSGQVHLHVVQSEGIYALVASKTTGAPIARLVSRARLRAPHPRQCLRVSVRCYDQFDGLVKDGLQQANVARKVSLLI